MGVDIHETRRNITAADIQSPPALQCTRRGDLSDTAALNGKIAPKPGVPAAIQTTLVEKKIEEY